MADHVPTPMDAARMLAAAVTHPAPEPGHTLAIETKAEDLLITQPDAVRYTEDHPERIALLIRTHSGFIQP